MTDIYQRVKTEAVNARGRRRLAVVRIKLSDLSKNMNLKPYRWTAMKAPLG